MTGWQFALSCLATIAMGVVVQGMRVRWPQVPILSQPNFNLCCYGRGGAGHADMLAKLFFISLCPKPKLSEVCLCWSCLQVAYKHVCLHGCHLDCLYPCFTLVARFFVSHRVLRQMGVCRRCER